MSVYKVLQEQFFAVCVRCPKRGGRKSKSYLTVRFRNWKRKLKLPHHLGCIRFEIRFKVCSRSTPGWKYVKEPGKQGDRQAGRSATQESAWKLRLIVLRV